MNFSPQNTKTKQGFRSGATLVIPHDYVSAKVQILRRNKKYLV